MYPWLEKVKVLSLDTWACEWRVVQSNERKMRASPAAWGPIAAHTWMATMSMAAESEAPDLWRKQWICDRKLIAIKNRACRLRTISKEGNVLRSYSLCSPPPTPGLHKQIAAFMVACPQNSFWNNSAGSIAHQWSTRSRKCLDMGGKSILSAGRWEGVFYKAKKCRYFEWWCIMDCRLWKFAC